MRTLRRVKSAVSIAAAMFVHEWLPSMCLVASLAAIFCPMLLILGLKNGTMENLRARILEDPRNLEIFPVAGMNVDEALLEKLRNLPGAGFLVPKTRSLGSAMVKFEHAGISSFADLRVTAPGDPVLGHYGCPVPGELETVVSSALARKLTLRTGDKITMALTRKAKDGSPENATLDLTVRGILPRQATGMKLAYVRLGLLSAVEDYRDNQPVPRFGWSGGGASWAEPVFDGFVVESPTSIPDSLLFKISAELGATQSPAPRFAAAAPAPDNREPPSQRILFSKTNSSSEGLRTEDLRRAKAQLAGTGASLYPWNRPRKVLLSAKDGKWEERILLASPVEIDQAESTESRRPVIVVPDRTRLPDPCILRIQSPVGFTEIPCSVEDDENLASATSVFASPWFAGILANADRRTIRWSENDGRFLLGRKNFDGFRLYAKSLPDVQRLVDSLASMGIECRSEAAKVASILELDRDLTKLFLLVASFSMLGGGAALALSLYGAVERRRRDYGTFRMLGLPRRWLVMLPVVEAGGVAVFSFSLAVAGYHLVSSFINRLFVHAGANGHGSCHLTSELLFYAFLCILALAMTGAVSAAVRLSFVSPSQAIRTDR